MSERHWLLSRIASFGARPALIWEGKTTSYSDLSALIDTWLGDLRARDIQAGECVAIRGDYSPETCALLIALIANRNVAVPLSRTSEQQHPENMRSACVTSVYTFERGVAPEHSRLPKPHDEPALLVTLRERGSPGLIVFSSGTTGKVKAPLLDFDRLLEKFVKPRRVHRTLAFLLIDHLGGLNTMFHVLCNGGAMVPLADRRVEVVCQAIQDHAVELLPTTPTFLKMLLISEAYRRYDLSSLKLISYGTEPMQASTLEHLQQVFPNVEIKQTYGLSELGALHTKSKSSGSLWVKLGGDGYEVKVVDNVLWIRSRWAMLGYLNLPSPFDEDGWFNTGDLVETDGEYVRILGRKSELINVGGEKVYPAEVESVLLEMDNVVDATVFGKPNPITGHVVAAKILVRAPEPREALIRRIRAYCKGRLQPYKVPITVEAAEGPMHGDRFKKVRS